MSLDPKTISELKEALLKKKNQLESELSRIADPAATQGDYTTKFNELGPDEDENASEVEEYTDNLALENTLEKQLREVLDALDRIDKKTYGFCENCSKEISIERLRAYPGAKTCIEC